MSSFSFCFSKSNFELNNKDLDSFNVKMSSAGMFLKEELNDNVPKHTFQFATPLFHKR